MSDYEDRPTTVAEAVEIGARVVLFASLWWEGADEDATANVRYRRDEARRMIRTVLSAVGYADLLREVERLHSWDGVMSLLDEHYPTDIFPVLPDREDRDSGPRILSLTRHLYASIAALRQVRAVAASIWTGNSGGLFTVLSALVNALGITIADLGRPAVPLDAFDDLPPDERAAAVSAEIAKRRAALSEPTGAHLRVLPRERYDAVLDSGPTEPTEGEKP